LHLYADKTYLATARLGVKTSTGDAEGDVIETRPVAVTQAQIDAVLPRFTGPIRQVPPMYSALKRDGKPLYEYARAGIEIERPARDVVIFELKVALAHVESAQDAIEIVARCSKGTYIRTLGEDIGEALGCGAHLTALRRIATGDFAIGQCVTLAELEAMTEDALLAQHRRVTLDAENAGRFLSGVRRRGDWPDDDRVAVYGDEPSALLGVAQTKAGELIPGRLLSPLDIGQILAQAQKAESPSL
jgi:tRNA pseudouridine55 synthase